MFGVRKTLKLGATVFGASALLLLLAPGFFLGLLGLESSSASLTWAMRMIAVTLVALAGNMWLHAKNSEKATVRSVGIVMALSATGLGVLTLLIPSSLTWFSIVYSAIGFLFGINYGLCIWRKLM